MSEVEKTLNDLKEIENKRIESNEKTKQYFPYEAQSVTNYIPIDAATFIKVIEELNERLKKLEENVLILILKHDLQRYYNLIDSQNCMSRTT